MWKIFYHKLVWEEDLKKISKTDAGRIMKVISSKLSQAPESFGKPLSSSLKGYFKLRVGDYRVVYRIRREQVEVFIVKIGFRRNLEVYIETAKRLGII